MAGELIRNLIVISDTHCGCKLGLCPPEVRLDIGGTYRSSAIQRRLYEMWTEFWSVWVPEVTHGEPYAVLHNGDAIDGVHHRATTQISHDLGDQCDIAYELLAPVVERCEGRYYHVRGTEAHVGQSGVEEERLAKRLGAIPDAEGHHARFDLWIRLGDQRHGPLIHALHHIGTTSSSAHESSAVNAELSAEYVEAARWRQEPPDFVVRSHRHAHIQVCIPTSKGKAWSVVTPCWQAKTPFAWKIAGARLKPPQFGGILIRSGDEVAYMRERVWSIDRSRVENPTAEGKGRRRKR